jgi:hypothetical protein
MIFTPKMPRVRFLAFQGPNLSLGAVGGDARFIDTDHDGSDDADASFIGHGRCQAGKRNSYTHPSLNNRKFTDKMTNFQRRQFHINISPLIPDIPSSRVQVSQFSVHISYFLQNCKKKANPSQRVCPF